jgi:glutamate formiminotransferase
MHGETFTCKALGSWPLTLGRTLNYNLASHITVIVYCFTVVWVNVLVNCDQRFGLFPLQETSYIRMSFGRLISTRSLPLGLYRRSIGQMGVNCISFLKKPLYQFIIMMVRV